MAKVWIDPPIPVTGTISGTVAVSGTIQTPDAKVEDTAASDGATGSFILAIRRDADGTNVSADGDYSEIQTDSKGQVKVVAGGRTVAVSASITRPADTTAYAAGDEISSSTSSPAVNTLTNALRFSGGSGVIMGAIVTDSAGSTTPPALELWIFNATTTPNNDNSAFAPTDTVVNTVVAIIPLGNGFAGDPTAGATGNRAFIANGVSMPVVGGGNANLYARLVTRSAYTPVASEIFVITIIIQQD